MWLKSLSIPGFFMYIPVRDVFWNILGAEKIRKNIGAREKRKKTEKNRAENKRIWTRRCGGERGLH
jgi:hypothetical protein